MNLTSPFSLSLIAIVGLSLVGLPVGYAMIGGSILWMFMSGLDMGTAAEQLLNGMMAAICCSRSRCSPGRRFMNSGSIMDRLLHFWQRDRRPFRAGWHRVNVADIIFASMSGSALAEPRLRKLMQSMMTRDGKYPPRRCRADCVVVVIGPTHSALAPAGALRAGFVHVRRPISSSAGWFPACCAAVQSALIAAGQAPQFPVSSCARPAARIARITLEGDARS